MIYDNKPIFEDSTNYVTNVSVFNFVKEYYDVLSKGELPVGKEKEIITLLEDYRSDAISDLKETFSTLYRYLLAFKYNLYPHAQSFYYRHQILLLSEIICMEYDIVSMININDISLDAMFEAIDILHYMGYHPIVREGAKLKANIEIEFAQKFINDEYNLSPIIKKIENNNPEERTPMNDLLYVYGDIYALAKNFMKKYEVEETK